MKRLFIIATILGSFISLSSFANNEKVSPSVMEAFQSSFKNAAEVSWTVNGNFQKAEFNMNGQFVSAFYSTEGQLLAVTRNISSSHLPVSLQASLRSNYEDLWITDLFEVANDEGTAYYITLENADTKLVLKSTGAGWSTFQKQRKA